MARQPRIHSPGSFYHVLLRGNGGQAIFFEDGDRYRLYLLFQEGVERYGYRIHGFCCMTNHLHMVIQVAETPLSKIVQNLSFRYTRWINRKQKRIGHLFQGRYKAILIDADAYLLELVRYIHLNPVRARLVRRPEGYPWSSYRAYLGQEWLPWLTTDRVLSEFEAQTSKARKRFEQFVHEGMGEGHRNEFYCGEQDQRILGEDDFVEQVFKKLEIPFKKKPPTLSSLIRQVSQEYSVTPQELSQPLRTRSLAEARGVVAWLAMERGSGTLATLSEQFGCDPSALSHAVRRINEKKRVLETFQEKLLQLAQK